MMVFIHELPNLKSFSLFDIKYLKTRKNINVYRASLAVGLLTVQRFFQRGPPGKSKALRKGFILWSTYRSNWRGNPRHELIQEVLFQAEDPASLSRQKSGTESRQTKHDRSRDPNGR